MPSQEATMPPALPYPYSCDEGVPSPLPKLSAEDGISNSILQSINSTDSTEQSQETTIKNFSNPHGQDPHSLVADLPNKPGANYKFLHYQPRGKDDYSSSSTINRDLGITARVHTSLFNNCSFRSHEISLPSTLGSGFGTFVSQDTSGDSAKLIPGKPLGFPQVIFARIVSLMDHNSLLNARATARSWMRECADNRPLRFSPIYRLPVELIQLILGFTPPTSFNAVRHVCRAWYLSALEPSLLRLQLKALGFYHADPTVQNSQSTRYLSTRLCRELSLGAGGSSNCGLRKTVTIDMSDLAATTMVHFTVSICGSYALLSEGCVVYVYRLQARAGGRIEFVVSVVCPRRVLAVSMDTSSRRFAIAILLDGRMGLVHDVVEQEAKSSYRNLCSEEDTPRSVAICPQRRCVAFGCHGGIELHWVDALTGQDLKRWFPLTAPSDFLYFLPPRRGIDSAKKLRLISSAAHPKEASPLTKRFGTSRGSLAFWGSWEPRAGQSDHFQAVPLSDGYHILFMDPESGGLCLGSDTPLGGPTKLLRKIWLIPPLDLRRCNEANCKEKLERLNAARRVEEQYGDSATRPSVYASGADMRFGVRIVAGYGDNIVLFSIPPDVFNGSKREDEFLESSQTEEDPSPERTSDASTEKPWKPINVMGCYIGSVSRLIDLAVDSGPNMAVYAFSANGQVVVYQLEKTNATITAGDQPKVARMVSRRNGEMVDETVDAKSEKDREVWKQVNAGLDGEVGSDRNSGTGVCVQDLGGIPWQDGRNIVYGDEYKCCDGFRVGCLQIS